MPCALIVLVKRIGDEYHGQCKKDNHEERGYDDYKRTITKTYNSGALSRYPFVLTYLENNKIAVDGFSTLRFQLFEISLRTGIRSNGLWDLNKLEDELLMFIQQMLEFLE